MKEAIDELESKKSRKDGITGVPSGFIDLDNITSAVSYTHLRAHETR